MLEIKKYSIALVLTFLIMEILCIIILSLIGVGPFQDPNYTRYRASGYYCFGNQPNYKWNGFNGFDNNTYKLSDYYKNEKYFSDNSKELFWITNAYSSTLIRDSVFPIVCLQPLLGRKDIQKSLTKLEMKLLNATQKAGRSGLVEKYFWGMCFAPKADSIMKKKVEHSLT